MGRRPVARRTPPHPRRRHVRRHRSRRRRPRQQQPLLREPRLARPMRRRRPPQPPAPTTTVLRRGDLRGRQQPRRLAVRDVRPQALLVRARPPRHRLPPSTCGLPDSRRPPPTREHRPDRRAQHRRRRNRTRRLELLQPAPAPAVDRHHRVRRRPPRPPPRHHPCPPRRRHLRAAQRDARESCPATPRPALAQAHMNKQNSPIASLLGAALANRKVIVICGRNDDAHAWRQLLDVQAIRSLVIALDDMATSVLGSQHVPGATAQLARQHEALSGLDGSGWLASQADAFDPDQNAILLLPDPLDPVEAGSRRRLGPPSPVGRLLEDKTVVDALWDRVGIPRARSVVTDAPTDIQLFAAAMDSGAGVVCSYQPTGSGPAAGGDGIWWWRHNQPPEGMHDPSRGGFRLRIMSMLKGLQVGLHGLVLTDDVVTFPPMEIVTLLRPEEGTFLCAGAVPTIGERPDLAAHTKRIGAGLRQYFGYRGAFSADGILTTDGFRPTDLNARLTSAVEAVPSDVRVQLHAANLLVREDAGEVPEPRAIEALARQAFNGRDKYTIYAAATRIAPDALHRVDLRWLGGHTVPAEDQPADGHLTLEPT